MAWEFQQNLANWLVYKIFAVQLWRECKRTPMSGAREEVADTDTSLKECEREHSFLGFSNSEGT